jgi:hypothetical protein
LAVAVVVEQVETAVAVLVLVALILYSVVLPQLAVVEGVDILLVLVAMELMADQAAVAVRQMVVVLEQRLVELVRQVKEIMEQEIKVLLDLGKLEVVAVLVEQQPM